MATHPRSSRSLLATFGTFFLVGTIGTGGYIGLYWALAHWWDPQPATVVAWFAATVATNVAHRRLTFTVTTERRRILDAVVQFATSLLGLAVSTALIQGTRGWGSAWHIPSLVLGTGLAGILRFACMKLWLDRSHGASAKPVSALGVDRA